MLTQLLPISTPEFRPARRVMAEPFPQGCAWGDLLNPLIDRSVRLLDATRPKAVDQDARAVAGLGRVIGTLQLDVGSEPLPAHDAASMCERLPLACKR